jgi:hypothetical protein
MYKRHIRPTCFCILLHDSITGISDFCGLDVACWPLLPKFGGSHTAEAVGFLGQKYSSARLLSGGKQNRQSNVVALRHVKVP